MGDSFERNSCLHIMDNLQGVIDVMQALLHVVTQPGKVQRLSEIPVYGLVFGELIFITAISYRARLKGFGQVR